MPREPRREERVCKIAEGGRAPASGSDQGRGVQNSQLLPPSLRVGKTELSLQLFPSPSPQDPHLCPVSPTQGCEARSDLLGASPGSLQLLLFPGSRPRAGVRGGPGGQECVRIGTLGSRSGIIKVHAGQQRGPPGLQFLPGPRGDRVTPRLALLVPFSSFRTAAPRA